MNQESIDEVISVKDFQTRILNNPQPCVLEYYASWCPPCKDLEHQKYQILPATSKRKGNWNWFKIDVDEDEKFTEEQNLAGIPTVILYNNGQEISRFVGLDLHEFQLMLTNLNSIINEQHNNREQQQQYQNNYNNNNNNYNNSQQYQQQQYQYNSNQQYNDQNFEQQKNNLNQNQFIQGEMFLEEEISQQNQQQQIQDPDFNDDFFA